MWDDGPMAGEERRALTRAEALEALGRMGQNIRRVTMRAVKTRRAGAERLSSKYSFSTIDSDHMLSKFKEDLGNETVYLRRAEEKMQQYSSEIIGKVRDADGRAI